MNSFGRVFRISIFGESHGDAIGIIVDGTPSGIKLSEDDFSVDLNRRKSGAFGTTTRIESDIPEIKSGVFNGFTSGAPILIQFRNNNKKSHDYKNLIDTPRPGHSDFTAAEKYNGYNDIRGGGHFSGRITLGLVAAGVIAKKILSDVKINACIPENKLEPLMEKIKEAQMKGDSVGAVIECSISGLQRGLGEPFFDSVESNLSHMIFSIPAIKGIEFGAGFSSADKWGSEINDLIIDKNGKTESNNSGGINGGITNGNDLVFRVVVKPTSSISKPQRTMNMKTNKIEDLKIEGRHDTCIALRVPVIVEAAAAIVLCDFHLLQNKERME